MTERYRFDDRRVETYLATVHDGGTSLGTTQWSETVYRKAQHTSSEGHPYQFLGRDHRTDIGGPFLTQKVEIALDENAHLHLDNGAGIRRRVTGTAIAHPDLLPYRKSVWSTPDTAAAVVGRLTAFRNPQPLSDSTLDAFGSTAISLVKPTNPTVDLAMSIGEFVSERKFFSLPGQAGSVPGEYLNYMFGIAPTIADVQDLRKAIQEKEKILFQYARDSGRLVRRRFEPDPVTSVSNHTATNQPLYDIKGGSFGDGATVGSGTLSYTIKRSTRQWFSGAFTYFLPKEGLLKSVAELDRLYGVVPGTALAWELTPYSWLVDYKLSVGSALKNLDSFAMDGLVMPYGYVMAEQSAEVYHTWTGPVTINGTWTKRSVSGKIVKTVKQRRPANPFGFGIKHGDLSLRQVSIIAALGLTKLER